MINVEFNYQQRIIIIQAKINDTFEVIIEKYLDKIKLDINNINFIFNGKYINKNEVIENIINESQIKNNKIIVLVELKNNIIENQQIEIICPECKEICKYEIKNYRINLYDCKNGHRRENIKLNEYLNEQYIPQVKCDECKVQKKSYINNNDIYLCDTCKVNLCSFCKSIHDRTHLIINYENKNYICKEHNEAYIKYCEDCQIDLCLSCLNEHENHKIIAFKDEIIEIIDIKN